MLVFPAGGNVALFVGYLPGSVVVRAPPEGFVSGWLRSLLQLLVTAVP
jgi:hypothetical protein